MNPSFALPSPLSPIEKDRSLLPISLFVIFTHAAFLIWSVFYFSPSTPMVSRTKLIVKTINLNEGKGNPNTSRQPIIQNLPIEKEIAIVEEAPPVQVKEATKEKPIEIAMPPSEPKVQPDPEPESKPEPEPQPEPESQSQQPEPKSTPKPNSKPIDKKTVQQKPKEKKTATTKPVKTKKPIAKAEPVPPKKPAVPKKPNPPKPDPKAEAAKAKQRALIEQAQKSIGKIQQPRSKINGNKSSEIAFAKIPGAIQGLHIDALPGYGGSVSLNSHEISYRDELASRLKLLLKLPEYGDVKIKLTLERSGKVAKVAIMSSESSVNRKYIEKTLPGLNFPSFGNNFAGQSQYVFVVKLSNDL